MDHKPIVMEGVLGWGNGDRRPAPGSLDAYGPEGRWGRRYAGNGALIGAETRGDHLADALVEAGAHEGATLIVVAVNRGPGRDATIEAVRRALAGL